MASELIDPANLKLVEFLKSNLDDSKRPIYTSDATKIIRLIFNEREGGLRGMTKADFLARAEELHEQRSSCDRNHACSTCFRIFRNWKDKDRHEKGIHSNDTSVTFRCLLCDKSFMSKTSLNYHIGVTHSESKPVHQCIVCKKVFSHEQSLKRHKSTGRCYIKIDENRIRPKCKLCLKTFSRKDALTAHKAKVHGFYAIDFSKAEEKFRQNDGSLKCSTCGQKFIGDNAREKMKTHVVNKCKSAVGVQQCEECGKPFGLLADLKTHIKMKHKKEYSIHSCKYCDFLSDYKAESLINTDMKRHIRTCHPTISNN